MSEIPSVDPTAVRPLSQRLVPPVLSRPGNWFYMNVASRIDPWLIRATRGRLDSSLGLVPLLLMSARGARTGLTRTVPRLYRGYRAYEEQVMGAREIPVLRLSPVLEPSGGTTYGLDVCPPG